MLEAVNTTLQASQVSRVAAEQVSTADSFAANPQRTQRAAPQAPYVSPYISVDYNYDRAVLQLRDSATGDVEGQFPSQAQLEAQARSDARRSAENQQRLRQVASGETPSVSNNVQAQASAETAPRSAPTQQQQQAFAAAAQSGNSNAGSLTLFA